MSADEQLGQYIATRRKELGLTQREVAAIMDVDYLVMSRIESGQRAVKASELPALADALETPVTALLGSIRETTPRDAERAADRARRTAAGAMSRYVDALQEALDAHALEGTYLGWGTVSEKVREYAPEVFASGYARMDAELRGVLIRDITEVCLHDQ